MLFMIFVRKAGVAVLLCIGSALFLGPFVLGAEADSEPQSDTRSKSTSWYVSTVVSGRTAYRVTHYWSKGPALRAQTMSGIHPITTIVRGDRYWVFDEIQKKGIEVKRSALAIAEDAKHIRPFGNDLEDLIQSNGEKVETGLLSGIPAESWRVTNGAGRRTVWVSVREPKVPLRVENFDRESGESATLNYSNWAFDFDLPDSTFEPPADLRLEKFEYEQYVEKSLEGMVGAIPVFYPRLLHGPRPY